MTPLKYGQSGRHATWLELFLDLVFVAAISAVTHTLSHAHHGHLQAGQIGGFLVGMVSIWWVWATHTLYANRYDTDNRHHRIATLGLMFVTAMMAAFCGGGLFEHFIKFEAFYVLIRSGQAIQYVISGHQVPDQKGFCRAMARNILIGTVLSVSSLLIQPPFRQLLFLSGILVEMVLGVYASRRPDSVRVDLGHLVERVGLLSIIILGESVIKLVKGLQEVAWSLETIAATSAGFLIIGLIWWIYFDSFDVLEKAIRLKSGLPVLYANIFFVIGLGLLANAIGYGIQGNLALKEFRWLGVVGICCFYLGKQVAYFTAIPIYRKNILINSTGCVLISLGSAFLPTTAAVLCGIALAMGYYVFSNYRWTLTKDASAYLEPQNPETS